MNGDSSSIDANENQSRHQCIIYKGSPSQKLPAIAQILKSKLAEGYRCLYLNSPPMIAGVRSTLFAIGIDISKVLNESLILSSETVLADGEFDSELMLQKLEDTLDQAINDGYKGLWASGDMTWEFGPKKDFSKLMAYELGLEDLFRRRSELHGICQYHQDTLPKDAMRQSLLVHQSLVINETLRIINLHHLKSSWPLDKNTKIKIDNMIEELCRE